MSLPMAEEDLPHGSEKKGLGFKECRVWGLGSVGFRAQGV